MPSTVVKTFNYDAARKELDILFTNGRRYVYHDVPQRTADAMRSAFAKGEFFNAEIRGRYRFSQVSPEPEKKQDKRFVLVLLGDSLTQGYGLRSDESLPAQLQRLIDEAGMSIEVRNAGVSGETSAQGLRRFDAATRDTDGVVIQFGGNDMLQGRSPSAIEADLLELVTRARKRGLWAGLVGMKAPPMAGPQYRIAFDRIFEDLAQAHSAPLYPFYFEGLVDERAGGMRQQYFLDRVHPNAKGVAIVAEGMARWLERVLPEDALAPSPSET
jgi:acyl-CoA thioesterase I